MMGVYMIQLATILVLSLCAQAVTTTDRGECENTSNIRGFAAVSFKETTVLSFFAEPNSSKQPAQVIRFYNDLNINSLSFRAEGKETYSLLRPEAHKLDYSKFELPVRSRRDGWLEVEVDEQGGKTLFVQENQAVRFFDWLSYLQESFSVERKRPEDNPLRVKPAGNAVKVKLRGRDCFEVKRMQGNWINVIQKDHCDGDSNPPVSGWLKWRDERGCLLIMIYPFA
jgi:hypothetical protein